MTRTATNGTAIGGSSGDIYSGRNNCIVNHIYYKLLNSNNNRSEPKLLRLLRDFFVFILATYLLNITYLNLLFILYFAQLCGIARNCSRIARNCAKLHGIAE